MAALPCLGTPAAYTPAVTAQLLSDQARQPAGTPAIGDFVVVEWDVALEGNGHTITIYTDGTVEDGGDVSGKVGQVVRLEAGTNGRQLVPVRGAARIHAAGSTAFGAGSRLMVGSW